MTGFELLALRLALASGGCLAAWLAAWMLATLCRRTLPAFCAQRSLWLLKQISDEIAASDEKKDPKVLFHYLEREKSLELSTSTLARLRSTN